MEEQADDGRDEGIADQEPEWPDPPPHDFDRVQEVHHLLASSFKRPSGSSRQPNQCFWRKIAWSPDGTHLLAQSDDHFVDMFKLHSVDSIYELIKVFSIRAPTTLLAVEWYPFARYDDAASWCFAISARDVPTRLVDAYQGRTRATYGIIDHVERFIGPQVLAFSLDGTRLYCALEAEIAIFDLSLPGINTHISLPLSPPKRAVSKGKAAAGQRGQISCLAVVQDHFAGTSKELLAVGTFAGTIGIYHMGEGTYSAEERCLVGWDECSAGVTQIAFNLAAPHIVFVTSRRDNQIRAYDLQYVGSRKSILHPPAQVSLLGTFDRSTRGDKESQQRFDFQLDWAGRFLVAGDAAGHIHLWNIAQPSANISGEEDFFGRILRDGEQAARLATHQFQAADDAIPSVLLHPTLPLLAVTSGARHWGESDEDARQEYHTRDGSLRLFATASLAGA